MSKSSLQPGTSLGILVGLVFGLVAASLVALYLANTGVPIQTRAQNPSVKINTPQDNTQVPDPNDSLYGKPFQPEIVEPEFQLTEEEQQAVKNKIKIKKESKIVKHSKGDSSTEKISYTAIDDNLLEIDASEDKATKNTSSELTNDQDGIAKIASLVTPETIVRKSIHKELDKEIPNKEPLSKEPPNKESDININEEKNREKKTSSQINNTDSANKGERYFIQVGAYANADDAKSVQSKAENQGIALNISSREGNGVTLHRLRTKALQPADAERLRNTIKANGMEAQLVRVQ
jgi:cell division protein FtsN